MAALCIVGSDACFAETVASDEGARIERLAEDVYVILHEDATDEWPHGNTGVVVGRTGLFVLDSTYLPSRARADIALIRRISDLPVRYLATTHWHMDHNNGAIAYREEYPEVAVVAERNTARWLELNQIYWSRMSTAADSPRRAALDALEKELARGADAQGKALPDAEVARLETVIEKRRSELDELKSLVVVKPDRLFDGELEIDLDGVPLVLHDWGRANSPDDVTLYLPRQKILFTGDIVVAAPLPFVSASWPLDWADVLRGLEEVPARMIVPGHGPVYHDRSYLQHVRTLLESTHERADRMARQGRTLEQIQEELNLDDVRAVEPAWMGTELDADWDATRRILIERVWRNMRGQY